MLRWKIQSALCATLISVCPLTSFAQQQTVASNPMLQPLKGTPTTGSRGLSPSERLPLSRKPVQGVASPEVVIRAPFVQPQNPNLYLFVIENVGTVDATAVAVDLHVSHDVTITKVVPASTSGDAQWAHVRLTKLAAGSKSIIEVEITGTTDAVEFKTRIALESVQKFKTTANSNYIADVTTNRSAPVKEFVSARRQEVAEDSRYLIPTGAEKLRHALPRVAAAKNTRVVHEQTPKKTGPGVQILVDEKLQKTVASLRLAGQDALADAYIAAVKNSKTYRAETF